MATKKAMHENLVIVESPAKAKTIEKFLGKDYTVMSSYGHIRDLSKKELGIDLKDNFKPDYEISPDKKKLVESLAKSAQESKTVWLASDEDREGEAIAWHLTQVLGLPVDQTKRIVFHEITKNAILEAIEHPRTIDMNLVNAQQARRLLDRLVGFELSPVLWKKVKPSLSAGRVQSVAGRLIVEREREIINFRSVSYYRITARFYRTDDPEKTLFRAELDRRFDTAAEAEAFLQTCSSSAFTVLGSESKPAERNPAGPFTTSTLQQEAGRKLGMSVSQTMTIAQRLYENGYITYMRTDSQNLSSQAIAAAHDEIVKLFGENYSRVRKYKTKSKGAQEAHEAIRPSYLNRREIEGSAEEKKLYDLIWKRTVASQMSSAKIEKTVVTIGADNTPQRFIATGEVVLFDGFMKLYSETVEEETEEGQENRLPELRAGDALSYQDIAATERFTQPPFRYSEASLVRKLEELGIGRPSTYAPTISTIINRGYVIKQNRPGTKRAYNQIKLEKGKITSRELSETVGREKAKLSPTDIGMIVTDYLDTHFEKILDYNFTANVEKEFDEIAEGEKEWTQMLHDFYAGFHPTVEKALEEQVDRSNKSRVLGIDPQSGHQVSARIGRYGPIVQIDGAEGEKPRYASLKKDQLIATITLEEALDLFKLPRTLGELEGKEVVVSTGRYGPYIRYDGKFTSLPRKEDPYSITLERAIELIHEKESADKAAKEPIKLFPEDTELKVLNGRYGPYIAYKGKNYRIPKGSDPAALTYEEACKIMETSKKKK